MDLEESIGYTDQVCVNTSYLKSNGYIESDDIKDPKTNSDIDGSVLIKKTASENYNYEFRQTVTCQSEYN